MKPIEPTIRSENSKIERLSQVLDSIEQQMPINMYSTFIIVAPENIHRQWQFALREVRDAFKAKGSPQLRAFQIVDIGAFEKLCEKGFDDQQIFMVDQDKQNTLRELFPRLKAAISLLKLDDGHRLFMTMEAQ